VEFATTIERAGSGNHAAALESFARHVDFENDRLAAERRLAAAELAKDPNRADIKCLLRSNAAEQRNINACLTRSKIGRCAMRNYGVKPILLDGDPVRSAQLAALEAKLRIARLRK
jgi:hypothetical protein